MFFWGIIRRCWCFLHINLYRKWVFNGCEALESGSIAPKNHFFTTFLPRIHYTLEGCGMVLRLTFSFLQPMLEHMRDVHGQELQSFPCPVDGCTSVYLQRFEMEDHVKKGRHSIKKTCEKCGVVSQVIVAHFWAMLFFGFFQYSKPLQCRPIQMRIYHSNESCS